MRLSIAVLAVALVMPCRGETPAVSAEHAIVSQAKQLDVAKLDPALKPQLLEDWLRHGPARVETLQWDVSDCDLKPDYPEPAAGYPLCVKAAFQRERVSGWLLVIVGTKRKGITEPPRFGSALVSSRNKGGMRSEAHTGFLISPV